MHIIGAGFCTVYKQDSVREINVLTVHMLGILRTGHAIQACAFQISNSNFVDIKYLLGFQLQTRFVAHLIIKVHYKTGIIRICHKPGTEGNKNRDNEGQKSFFHLKSSLNHR